MFYSVKERSIEQDTTKDSIDFFMERALLLQRVRPDFMISGSLALIFQGIIEPRKVHDLDMCVACSTERVKASYASNYMHRASSWKCGLYEYSVTTSRDEIVDNKRICYDLFLMSQLNDCVTLAGIKFHGFRCILDAKEKMARLKDDSDIKQFRDRCEIPLSFPFHLLPADHKYYKEKR